MDGRRDVLRSEQVPRCRLQGTPVNGSGDAAAYNAGPARYEEHLVGRPLPAETQAYLQKLAPVIGSDIATSSAVASLRPSAGSIFIVRPESSKAAARVQPER